MEADGVDDWRAATMRNRFVCSYRHFPDGRHNAGQQIGNQQQQDRQPIISVAAAMIAGLSFSDKPMNISSGMVRWLAGN
ncbi:MAG: hypothetical protein ACTHNH_22925 [Mesorhizobium sp.]